MSRHRHNLFFSICVMPRLFTTLLSHHSTISLLEGNLFLYQANYDYKKTPYTILLIRKLFIKTSYEFPKRLNFKEVLPLLYHFQSTFSHPLVPPYFPYTRPLHGWNFSPVGKKKRTYNNNVSSYTSKPSIIHLHWQHMWCSTEEKGNGKIS